MKRHVVRNILSYTAGLFGLYLLSIMPSLRKKPDKNPMMGYDYAHRGLHNRKEGIPENSLAAFERAKAAGYGIELDVQLTKDKVPVVFHDFTLDRVCQVPGKLSDYTYEELMEYRLYDTEEYIPKFEEVLELIAGKVPLIVEMKIEWSDAEVCKVADELLKCYKGVYCIESFSPMGLLWYRKNRPEVIRGQLSMNFSKNGGPGERKIIHRALKNLLFNFITKPDFIAYDYRGAGCISRRLCKSLYRNLSVAYTITTQKQMDEYRKDFDLFIFEQFLPD